MNNRSFRNKVAIVTGSSIGIGKAIANDLCSRGMKVVINARDLVKLNDTAKEFRALGYDIHTIQADIRFADQCENLINETIKKYGQIDILVNNAAVSSRGSVEDMAVSVIEILIDTNYIGSAYMSKFAIPQLRKSKGSLIFVNSIAGFKGMPYNSAYSASKTAQAALADAIRIELVDDGVHVGTVHVGFTENDPRKTILDVDGSWVLLPKRKNVKLAKPGSVAKRIFEMIQARKPRIALSRLGYITSIIANWFPRLFRWLVYRNRKRIKEDFTFIGARTVKDRIYTIKEVV